MQLKKMNIGYFGYVEKASTVIDAFVGRQYKRRSNK
jgi:hypothetical protein